MDTMRHIWMTLLMSLVLCSLLSVVNSRDCFYGTTNECKFPCNCRNGADCEGPERGPESGRCPIGQCGNAGGDTTFPYGRDGDSTCLYGNQAVGKRAWQTGNSQHTADRAVDGNTVDHLSGTSCSVAQYDNGQLYWYVDLQRYYLISKVRIYTERNNRESVRGVRLYVTDTSQVPDDRDDLCRAQSDSIGSRVNIDCNEIIGRYIWLVHDQVTEDDDLVICEVSVEGYLYYRCEIYEGQYRYGPGCLQKCNCDEQCDRVSGACAGECVTGSVKNSEGVCIEECDEGHWGVGCAIDCHCQGSCDHVDGTCDGSCDSGYEGDSCQYTCSANSWGQNCSNSCNCQSSCHHITGQCLNNQCAAGFYGSFCSNVCIAGTWGTGDDLGCENLCNCRVPCNAVTGLCQGGCAAGYQGQSCQEMCEDGTWGDGCLGVCQCEDENEMCDKVSGNCDSGCAEWYVGDGCSHQLPSLADTRVLLVQNRHQNITIQVQQVDVEMYYILVNITYHVTSTAEDWQYVHNFFHDRRYQWNLSFLLSANSVYSIRIIPWDVEYRMEGKPSPEIIVDTFCDDGFWGSTCKHSCRCTNVSEVCDKVYGTCGISGCDSSSLGIDCYPTIEHSTIDFAEGDAQITLTVEQFQDSHIVNNYNVSYNPKYGLDLDQVTVPASVVSREEETVDDDKIQLRIPWKDQYINTQYQFQVIPVYITSNGEALSGKPSALFEADIGCGLYKYASESFCEDWCICNDDRNSLCLKTCDYCNSCQEEPKLPSDVNIEVSIDNILETSMRVNVEITFDTTNFAVHSYTLRYNNTVESHGNAIIIGPAGHATLGGLEPDSVYTIYIFPTLTWNAEEISGFPVLLEQATKKKAKTTNSLMIGIVVAVSVIVILVLIIIGLLFYIRKRQGLPCFEKSQTTSSKSTPDKQNGTDDDDAYYITNVPEDKKVHNMTAKSYAKAGKGTGLLQSSNKNENQQNVGYRGVVPTDDESSGAVAQDYVSVLTDDDAYVNASRNHVGIGEGSTRGYYNVGLKTSEEKIHRADNNQDGNYQALNNQDRSNLADKQSSYMGLQLM